MRLRYLLLACISGLLLRGVVTLHPVAWLAWLAPLPLLLAAYQSSAGATRIYAFLAALIGYSVNFGYFRLMMPLGPSLLILVLQSLLWLVAVGVSRRLVLGGKAWWTVFAYPCAWAVVDYLQATLLPDGNWGSLAYTQCANLPVLQFASLAGMPGVIFLVSLPCSLLAVTFVMRGELRGAWKAWVVSALLLTGSFGYGAWRLRQPVQGPLVTIGMAAVDDSIGRSTPTAKVNAIWSAYDGHIKALAGQGAHIVVLGEAIAELQGASREKWLRHLDEVARQNHVWIAAGVREKQAKGRVNLEWLIDPDGTLRAVYQKHHLAPPERDMLPGSQYEVREIDSLRYGLAICKDLHFASMGEAYAGRQAVAMLVPAWDFDRDRWLASRMTAARGVESGLTIIRSSREGQLSVSDARGRFVAEAASAPVPGARLLARVQIGEETTLYSRVGDSFSLLCWLAVMLMYSRVWRVRQSLV
jgi:apolipoprotein N-acyltransferase